MYRQKDGFTMIELVFVIMILGIVASIGSEIIARIYQSYIVERAMYRANLKTELALQQIANRMRYAISGTVGYRNTLTSTFYPITFIPGATNNVLQWVSYDGDSFEAISSSTSSASARRPGWSGFIDLNTSTINNLQTPGSNLSLTDEIIQTLSGSSKTIADAVIYFPHEPTTPHGLASSTGTSLVLDTPLSPGDKIYERYKLAWSSYALEVNNGDLILHYNFSPNRGAAITGDKKALLLKNVSNFRFKGSEGSLRIKLCKEERITNDTNVSACKEKVIF